MSGANNIAANMNRDLLFLPTISGMHIIRGHTRSGGDCIWHAHVLHLTSCPTDFFVEFNRILSYVYVLMHVMIKYM